LQLRHSHCQGILSPTLKTLLSICGLLMIGMVAAPLTLAQNASNDDAKAQSLVEGAMADFNKNQYDAALIKLNEADKIKPSTPFILNLIGAALTKKKDYAGAKQQFDAALAIDYAFFPAQFNLGEIFFLQKQYTSALDHFSRMLRNYPDNELLQFKVILCLLLTDHTDDAKKLADRMKFPGQEPAWYYAQAALAIKAGDKGAARKNLSAADTLYQGKTSLYSETFQDLDWPTK
jgi:tetratricopeptide (TPR) repeat protein